MKSRQYMVEFHGESTGMLERAGLLGRIRRALKRSRVVALIGPRQSGKTTWATHQGAELDLLLFKGGRRLGIEIKRVDAPTITPSMRIALSDLRLDQLTVLYPGSRVYDLDRRIRVVPLAHLADGKRQEMLGARRRPTRR